MYNYLRKNKTNFFQQGQKPNVLENPRKDNINTKKNDDLNTCLISDISIKNSVTVLASL